MAPRPSEAKRAIDKAKAQLDCLRDQLIMQTASELSINATRLRRLLARAGSVAPFGARHFSTSLRKQNSQSVSQDAAAAA